jgi:transcription-repair coupling factor (superfamily II helicase)
LTNLLDIGKQSITNIYPVNIDNYAYVISNISTHNKTILFIANDELELDLIEAQINFFAPHLKITKFIGWDCNIYDKVSPNISNMVNKINALYHLINCSSEVVLTHVSAIMQKLPPRKLLENIKKTLSVNDIIKRDELLNILLELGFRRVEVATDLGDFAVRGDIIDIVSLAENGWRVDFIGNKVENIRIFDTLTQLSISKKLEKIDLMASNEVILNDATIKNFCQNFIKAFGHKAIEHPLYQAIETGRKYPGMEHYLSLFYEYLDNIFDYFIPEIILCDHNFDQAIENYENKIIDGYKTRDNLLHNRFQDEVIYYPVKPESMWLSKLDIKNQLLKYKVIYSHNFNCDIAQALDLGIKLTDNFYLMSQSKNISSFDSFRKYRDNIKSKIIIACNTEGSLQHIQKILENYNIHSFRLNDFNDYKKIKSKNIGLAVFPSSRGYKIDDFAIISEQDLLGERIVRKKATKKLEHLLAEINNLQIGEYVVHQQHGIGIFIGLETLTVSNLQHDFLKLEYEDGDFLYLPVENVDLLSRYGSNEVEAKLDKLGSASWKNRKEKLKEKLKEIAAQLIKTAAARASKHANSIVVKQDLYEEFCLKFPYLETEDQINAIKDVEQDLSSSVPMDRLICGDVGFGKTEVAMRAAFITLNPENNTKQQVAIIVPTTLLARQHYHAFVKRFNGFDVQIRQISRLVSSKERKLTKLGLEDGSIDIVIGTHALFTKDITFKNLGLLVIDEEQRFGVLQKEKLKQLQDNVHILTLSATPIPRTLQMSLTGVKELSIIASPPVDRQVVKTYIMNYNSAIIRETILREFNRGGQIFFVCPRISDINELLPKLSTLVPEIKIVVAHGQMSPAALEEIMSDFYNKKFHLLLSTSIVESGIDIAEANTIFIHRADKFGLSALYQLRGRVGRSNIKAFAYLFLPNKKISKTSMAKLEVMQTLDSLGAGFTVASHDMDIRGFGNLVGDEQSGHIREVGLELYQEMLQEAIANLKREDHKDSDYLNEEYSPQINIDLPITLPSSYVEDLSLRLSLYRNLASFRTIKEIDDFAVEMIDRFGMFPIEVEYLLSILKLKIKAKQINVDKIDAGSKAITFSFKDNRSSNPEKLLQFIQSNLSYMKIRADSKVLIKKTFNDATHKLSFINELLDKITLIILA